MDHLEKKLTIIIPSIGRVSVEKLLHMISKDSLLSKKSIRIIIALNGHQEFKVVNPDVEICNLGADRIGFSEAVNRVINLVKTPFTCIVADDDVWLLGKLEHDLSCLIQNDVVLASYNFVDNLGAARRPRTLYNGDKRPSEFLFEKFSFFRSKRYISISGVALRTEILKRNHFDSTLFVREDIEWLDRIYDNGIQIRQSASATMGLNVDLGRAANREDSNSLRLWVDILAKNSGYSCVLNFLSGAALKPHVVMRNKKMIDLVTSAAAISLPKNMFRIYQLRRFLWICFGLLVSQFRKFRLYFFSQRNR